MKNNEDGFVLDDSDVSFPKYSPQCSRCAFLDDTANRTCAAYPDGIPDDIWLDTRDHDEVQPDQTGNTVFEEVERS